MNWQRDTGTRKLNTLGDEEQVQTIKAGQTIAKGGAHRRIHIFQLVNVYTVH